SASRPSRKPRRIRLLSALARFASPQIAHRAPRRPPRTRHLESARAAMISFARVTCRSGATVRLPVSHGDDALVETDARQAAEAASLPNTVVAPFATTAPPSPSSSQSSGVVAALLPTARLVSPGK